MLLLGGRGGPVGGPPELCAMNVCKSPRDIDGNPAYARVAAKACLASCWSVTVIVAVDIADGVLACVRALLT